MTFLAEKSSIKEKYLNSDISSIHFPHLFLLFQNSSTDFDILQNFKRTPKLKSIPIIVISEISDETFVKLCYSHGANALVPAPENEEDMPELIQLIYDFWGDFTYLPHLDKSQ